MPLLEAQNLRKSFRGPNGLVRALDGVSLEVGAGEFVAIKGPSGCGKTTLLLVLGGLLRPDEGTLIVAGRRPYELSPERRARIRAESVGFVFQQFHLAPYLSVLDNVLAPSLALPGEGVRERARELVERFGLGPRADHVPAMLSTGERQRTALARALLNRPKLLLADEPTGNLDEENAEITLRHMDDFVRGGGAVVLVTHETLAAARAQRILTMRGGRIE